MNRRTSANLDLGEQPNDRSFEEILSGVRAGSEPDIRALAAYCIERMHTRCQRRLVRYQVFGIVDADDIINDMLQHFTCRLQVDGLPGVRDSVTFEKWVNIEIRQRTAKAYRKYRVDRTHLQRNSLPNLEESVADAADPVSDTDSVDDADHLDRALIVLPEELRGIARLHLTRSSQTDIARQLGMCRKTVIRKLKLIYDIWRKSAI